MATREELEAYVAIWRRAGEALEEVRRQELQHVDVEREIRDIFGDGRMVLEAPRLTTSGLVEQQAWYARYAASLETKR